MILEMEVQVEKESNLIRELRVPRKANAANDLILLNLISMEYTINNSLKAHAQGFKKHVDPDIVH